MTDTQKKPFRLEEATIEELHAAIRGGETTCVAVVQHYIERARAYNGVASLLVTEDGGPVAEATGTVRAGAPLHFPTETVAASDDLPRSRQIPGPAARIRPHGGDRLRSRRAAAIRHDRRQARMPASSTRSPPSTSAASARSPARASSTAIRRWAAAARRAAGLRGVPPAARRARNAPLSSTPVRPQSRRSTKMPMYGVVFSFKDPFDTKDMRTTARRRRRLRHRLPGARPHPRRAAAQQGRDHLRQGGLHRIQRPRRQSRRPAPAREGVALDARLSAQHLGRQPRQCL